jgi:hypothetical protein
MTNKSVESQAREYVYDLKNCASEFGQSTLEGWEFSLVSAVEKAKIEKSYYPTVSAHPAQEALLELFRVVKSKILPIVAPADKGFDINSVTRNNLAYLIAFNPKFHR